MTDPRHLRGGGGLSSCLGEGDAEVAHGEQQARQNNIFHPIVDIPARAGLVWRHA